MLISKYIRLVLIFALFSIASFTANSELVGYWSFDIEDGTTDLTENGHDGVIHGKLQVVEGKVGDALEFNGSTDYVAIPDHKAISELDALSMSAWIQPKKLGAWVAVLEKVSIKTGVTVSSLNRMAHFRFKFLQVRRIIWSAVWVMSRLRLINGIISSGLMMASQ